MIFYHGSKNLFDAFSYDAIGSNVGTSSSGHGFYLTKDKDRAKGYANENGYLYQIEFDITNTKSLSVDELTLSREEFIHMVTILQEKHSYLDDAYDVGWIGLDRAIELECENTYDNCNSDVDIIGSMINGWNACEDILQVISVDLGYRYASNKEYDEIVVFDNESVRIEKVKVLSKDLNEIKDIQTKNIDYEYDIDI